MEKITIIDFGSQYTQLIARRIRELNVYSEIIPFSNFSKIDSNTKGVILSGGPCSVLDQNSPKINTLNFRGKIPVLGLCYGAQLIAFQDGGRILKSKIREYGRATLNFINNDILMDGVNLESQVWMSHGDTISVVSKKSKILASTKDVRIAAFCLEDEDGDDEVEEGCRYKVFVALRTLHYSSLTCHRFPPCTAK